MIASLFLLALTSLAASPLFVKWAQAPVEFLGFWRLMTAGLLILAWLLIRGKAKALFADPWPRWGWAILAGFFFFVHLWTYVSAAQTTSIAHLTILFATNPIFTVAGAGLFFRERLPKRLIIAYPLAFAGIWLLAGEKLGASPQSHWGDILAILSAILHAAYLLCSKRARQSFDNLSFSVGLYLTAGFLFAIVGWYRHIDWQVPHWQAWAAVAGLILFPTFLGHALMTYLIQKMNISLLSCGKLLEPGISSFLAYLLFQEQFTALGVQAFLLAGASVILLFWPQQWMPKKFRKT